MKSYSQHTRKLVLASYPYRVIRVLFTGLEQKGVGHEIEKAGCWPAKQQVKPKGLFLATV